MRKVGADFLSFRGKVVLTLVLITVFFYTIICVEGARRAFATEKPYNNINQFERENIWFDENINIEYDALSATDYETATKVPFPLTITITDGNDSEIKLTINNATALPLHSMPVDCPGEVNYKHLKCYFIKYDIEGR
jgi:hypothetical protein